MRRIVTLSLAAAALLSAGGAAYAQAHQAPARERDPLTRNEVEQHSAAMFAGLDVTSDGKLDQADRDARRQARLARRDANSDGIVDEADRAARQKAMFDRADADKNGAVSYEEFAAVRGQRQDQRAELRGPGRDSPRMDRRGRGGPRGGMGDGRQADTNRDGTVTQAEFASAALARFDRVDVNKDGTISADERPADRRHRRDRGQRGEG